MKTNYHLVVLYRGSKPPDVDILTVSAKSVIYCDMDGVLCDFFSAASSHADRPIDQLSVRQLWTLVRQVPDFWFNLEWLPGARELWKLVNEFDAHILSSLAYSDPCSGPGKLAWLEKNTGLTDTARIHLMSKRSHKQNYATVNGIPNILIDDYEKNINEWKESGGTGILHTCATETIQLLHELGFRSTADIDGDSFA